MGSTGLFIGVNGPRLRFAIADAEDLAQQMRRYGIGSTVLTGEQATRTNIEKAMSRAGRGGLFVFFYAGHGQQLVFSPGA